MESEVKADARGLQCVWGSSEQLGGCFWGRFRPRPVSLIATTCGKPAHEWIYQAACKVIEQHLADTSLNVCAVARLVSCSRTTVYRAFAQRRQTVAETIRMLRLLRACEMLAVPPYSLPIETVAYRCGFEEVRTFNRCFSKFFGMSAGRYREARIDERLKALRELADT
ncbi:helix-turn-helix domain-containing protein [Pseudomonas putida]|uniref:helix-turn-helix domain-containing protein n=1 Tax=Pseudomonas putida TaxID=303 RepID=UPI0013652629|nr:helix-turn-helix domain-containing protein [Pseudomonas putida]